MKKQTSILISFIITLVITGLCSFSAFAETTTKYWEPKPNCQDITPCVNSVEFGGVIDSSYNPSTEEHLFTYEGEGVVTGWEFPTSKENVDYQIISQKGNSITIKLINENHELPYINALVDLPETTSSAATKADNQNKPTKVTTTEKAKTTIPSTQENITSSTAKETTVSTTAVSAGETDSKSDKQNKMILPFTAAGVISTAVIGFVLLKKYKK